MSYYTVLLFVHIAAAAIWIGSATLFFVLIQRAKWSGDPVLAERLAAHTAWLANRLFIPAAVVVVLGGVLLTIEGPWKFDQLWILLGLAGFVATFTLGVGVIEPTTKKLHAVVESHGPAHPDAARYGRRLDALGLLDLTLLFSLIWDMALKPSADDTGTLLVPALALAAAALFAFRAYRWEGPEAAQPTPTSG